CLLPVMGLIIKQFLNVGSLIPYFFYSVSPFSIIITMHEILQRTYEHYDISNIILMMAVNIVAAITASIYAHKARVRIKKEALS
ncbi:MAG: hypothetical protein PHR22_04925, partial [Candidatus Omnitrophica bacterium]|nr:hypothetical protein [Candidatus Omnitrophota bacterium]